MGGNWWKTGWFWGKCWWYGDEMIQVVGGEVFRDKKDLPPKNWPMMTEMLLLPRMLSTLWLWRWWRMMTMMFTWERTQTEDGWAFLQCGRIGTSSLPRLHWLPLSQDHDNHHHHRHHYDYDHHLCVGPHHRPKLQWRFLSEKRPPCATDRRSETKIIVFVKCLLHFLLIFIVFERMRTFLLGCAEFNWDNWKYIEALTRNKEHTIFMTMIKTIFMTMIKKHLHDHDKKHLHDHDKKHLHDHDQKYHHYH